MIYQSVKTINANGQSPILFGTKLSADREELVKDMKDWFMESKKNSDGKYFYSEETGIASSSYMLALANATMTCKILECSDFAPVTAPITVYNLVATVNDDNTYGMTDTKVFGSLQEAREEMTKAFHACLEKVGETEEDGTWMDPISAHVTLKDGNDHYDWTITECVVSRKEAVANV